MRALALECVGGLDQESSNLEITPGRVRDSLNYEALPMGGYRRVDGWSSWEGGQVIGDFLSTDIQALEVSAVTIWMRHWLVTVTRESALGVKFRILGYREILVQGLVTGYYLMVKLSNERQRLAKDDVLDVHGDIVSRVTVAETTLSDEDFTELVKNTFARMSSDGKPEGDGPIRQIIHLDDRIYAIRSKGNICALSRIVGTNAGAWAHLEDMAMLDGTHWDHDVYQFAGRPAEMFVVNGENHVVFMRDGLTGNVTLNSPTGIDNTGPAPTHVVVFKEHLFVAVGTSIMHSGIGDPLNWDAATGGAGEIRVGKEITGLEILPGNALAVFTEETIHILYGTSAVDWRLEQYSREIGALRGTTQQLPVTIFWDRRGIQMLEATDAYGDFTSNTLSHGFYDLFQKMKGDTLFSTVNRAKSQYRVLNSTGRGVYMTFNNKTLVGAMEVDLMLDSPISCVGTRKNLVKADDNFLGLEDGSVLITDFGPSFGGKPIESFLKFSFLHGNNPVQKKRWRVARFHMTGDQRTRLQGRGEMEYGQDFYDNNRVEDMHTEVGEMYRNPDDQNAFVWDHPVSMEAQLYLEGSSSSIGLVVRSESDNLFSHTIHNVVVSYTDRGVRR